MTAARDNIQYTREVATCVVLTESVNFVIISVTEQLKSIHSYKIALQANSSFMKILNKLRSVETERRREICAC